MQNQDTQGAADMADAAAVQAFLRARARNGVPLGPFSILFSPGDRGLYANYAIPADDARPTPTDIAALEDAFRTRKRTPRLEYVPAAAPAVEAALLAAGFEVELRPPLMTCRRTAAGPRSEPAGFSLTFVEDPQRLALATMVAAEAFGGEASDAQWLMSTVRLGGRVLLAHDRASGEPAGTGAFIRPQDGVTEVVGIGVRPAFRRRGLAQAMTAMLSQAAFDAGCHMAFLSAAGEAQSAIYARAGFLRRAPMLFIAKS
ncbi:GNAT family N-acetyltransferase [Phenylobacterium sp.]|uniref:GNAT family N-acetyltransferase n=1 Tax=Phenylobacterium sp. TaxID=1871053 RepID=UPI00286DA2D8|nr:GNAT family N-acetyltransferase [Phenylobacterium sp.]